MTTLILVVVGLACLALVEALWYGVRYAGERQRAALRRRLGVLREESTTTFMRERRVARSPAIERMLDALPFTEQLERLLQQTDLTWTVAGTLGAGVGLSVALLAAGSLAGIPLLAWLALPLGFCVPWMIVLITRARRSTTISAQLPEALDMMVRSLRAGHGVNSAMKLVASELPVPVAAEFARCFEEMNLGVELRQAVDNLTERVPGNLDLKILAVSISLQHETGGNLVELLDQISSTIRERYKFYGKLAALTAEGKVSGTILGSLPFVTTGLMLLTNPGYLQTLTTDPFGRYLMGAAVGVWCVGVIWLMRLTKLEF